MNVGGAHLMLETTEPMRIAVPAETCPHDFAGTLGKGATQLRGNNCAALTMLRRKNASHSTTNDPLKLRTRTTTFVIYISRSRRAAPQPRAAARGSFTRF